MRYLKGEKVFRGYEMFQHSSSGRRSVGVMIFTKRGFNPIQGTIRNSRSGHFTIGAYEYKREKIVMGGINGNCTAADGPSAEIFTEYVEFHRELRNRLGDTHATVANDFNLKLDVAHDYKPRSTGIIRNFLEECNLDDAGGEMRMPTSPQKSQ
jgi:hypothetical protein